MTDQTSVDDQDSSETAENETSGTEVSETETNETETSETDQPLPEVDDSALEQARESIEEAKDAEGAVASSDDITTLDAERAGRFSEDEGGAGGT